MRWTTLALFLLSVTFATGQARDAKSLKQERTARALLARGKAYKALRICDARLGGTPDPVFYAIRADAWNRIGEHEKAEKDARTALAAFPGNADGLFQLALAEQGQGGFDSAAVHLQQVLAVAPSPDVRYQLAQVYVLRKDHPAAMRSIDEALATAADGPSTARLHRVKGECAALMGDSLLARQELDRAVALGPDDPVNYNSRGYYGQAYFGRHQAAILDYDRALKLNPNYSYAFNNRGWSWYKLGQVEKGIADIERARRRKVFNPFVYRNLGVIALERGDTAKACPYFRQALDYGFTALYGDEVEQLMAASCKGQPAQKAPVQAPNAPLDKKDAHPTPRTNAP